MSRGWRPCTKHRLATNSLSASPGEQMPPSAFISPLCWKRGNRKPVLCAAGGGQGERRTCGDEFAHRRAGAAGGLQCSGQPGGLD